ncbi:MAG: endonuclease/exonuclease/phosphatase family protein [Bacteroidales bacterium]
MNLSIIKIIVALSFLCTTVYAQQTPTKETMDTYLYSVKGKDSLFLDRYYPANELLSTNLFVKGKRPCLIFVFGGGFFTGRRNNEMYIPYYKWLVKNGFNVVAIDYRLGLKPIVDQMSAVGTEKKPKLNPFKLVDLLFNSVNIAVEDLYDATNFVLAKSKEWGIDTSLIISCGSSAGAITVLQGEYYRSNNKAGAALKSKLSKGFNYAGVISFAGAIANKHGKIKWDNIPAPIQFFHGNADSNVPYDKMKTILGGLYGSNFITKEFNKINAPYYFLTADNATHTIATTPMNIYRDQIWEFISKMVIAREPLMINETIAVACEPVKNKEFGVKDYLRANFAGGKGKISMLSYNVHNCIAIDSAKTRDYKQIAEIIKMSKAEVVALQELDSVTARTPLFVLGELEKETGMFGSYAPAIDYGGGKYGVGILSKAKPIAVKHVALPGSEEKRVLLIAEFDKYIFCCTHLSLTPADQLASIQIIMEGVKDFIREDKGRREKPVFIGGDFNAARRSATMVEFCKYATPVSNIAMDTFPANDPNRCIDYLFLLNKKMPKNMEVLTSGRIINTITGTASDHLPVFSVTLY